MSDHTLEAAKAALRQKAIKLREQAFARHSSQASEALARHGIGFANPPAGAAVSGFLAIRDEIDPQPLMLRLYEDGHRLALPVMRKVGLPLVMRKWAPGDALNEVKWGIREPGAAAPEVEPDILLVPLLAFDDTGQRIGYGRGFYDRTISALRGKKSITTIGIAFDEQRVESVPCDDKDEPLDWILTPSGPTRCSG